MRTRIHSLRLFRSFPDPCRGFRMFTLITRKNRVRGGKCTGDDDFRLSGKPSAEPGMKDSLNHEVNLAHPDTRDSHLGMHRLPDFGRRFGEPVKKYGFEVIGMDRAAAAGKNQGEKSDFSGDAGRKFRFPRRPEPSPFAFRVLEGNRFKIYLCHNSIPPLLSITYRGRSKIMER